MPVLIAPQARLGFKIDSWSTGLYLHAGAATGALCGLYYLTRNEDVETREYLHT